MNFGQVYLGLIALYWVFAAAAALMLAGVGTCRIREIERTEEEQPDTWKRCSELLWNPIVLLYFVSVFAYVGSEQGTTSWISQFLWTYHGVDLSTTGALTVAWFWGLLTIGRLVGMGFLKVLDSRRVLAGAALGALVTLTAALFGGRTIAIYAFSGIGLFASVMLPAIISLGLNWLKHSHGAFVGIPVDQKGADPWQRLEGNPGTTSWSTAGAP